MEYSEDRLKEKTQEIKVTVRVDQTHMIENYHEIANNAFRAGNLSEAEAYCNKIIEIDSSDHKAWLLKGSVVGSQSSAIESRLKGSISAFARAFENAPEPEKDAVIQEAKKRWKRFVWP